LCHNLDGLLLAGDGSRRALAGPRIGVGALTVNGQAFAVTQAAIAAEVHQPLNVHRGFAAQVAFDLIVAIDDLADPDDIVIGQLIDARRASDTGLVADVFRALRSDPIDIGQANLHPLFSRDVNACNARHAAYSWSECGLSRPP